MFETPVSDTTSNADKPCTKFDSTTYEWIGLYVYVCMRVCVCVCVCVRRHFLVMMSSNIRLI